MNHADATWRVETAWPLPPWAMLLAAIAVAAFVLWIYWHENGGLGRWRRVALASTRLAAIAIVALMISQATLSWQRFGTPRVAVVVDDSLSMTVADDYADMPRRTAAERLLGDATPKIKPGESPRRWQLLQALVSDRNAALWNAMAAAHPLQAYCVTGSELGGQKDAADALKKLKSLLPTGKNTRLGDAVRAAIDEQRNATPAAVVLLTDGVNTDGATLADASEYARRRGVPLYFVGFGSERPPREAKLSDLLVDDVVFVNDVVNFECKLTAVGCEGKNISVVLREKNSRGRESSVLARAEIAAGPDGRARPVRLQYRPTAVGQFEYVVEIASADGERLNVGSRLSRVVQVRKERIRVLLASAYPNYEFRYLRNMLGRDATIALHTVLQDADPEHASQEASTLKMFPQTRAALFAYDVIILGDVNPSLLSVDVLKNLADFVEQPAKGGALILIAGPAFMPAAYRNTPVARLLPFDIEQLPYPGGTASDGVQVRPTELGAADPAMQFGDTPEENTRIWKSLPPLYWLLEMPSLKPGVRVLADCDAAGGRQSPRRLPLFCFQYTGAGKVLFHATDETWRWRYRVGDRYFARYWIQTIRLLCRARLSDAGQAVSLTTDRRGYVQGDTVRLRARFADERVAPAADDGVTVVIEQPGRQTQQVVLRRTSAARGVFDGQLDRATPGEFHAWIVKPALEGKLPTVDFTVAPPPGEFADTRMDAVAMRRAADATGGRFYTFAAADKLPTDLPAARPVPIETLPSEPLWNRWPTLAALLGCLIVEWIGRKRSGLA